MTLELRRYFIQAHITQEISIIVPGKNEISLQLLESHAASRIKVRELATTKFEYSLSSILLMHKESEYVVGGINFDAY